MPIEWQKNGRQLHLFNKRISYIMKVLDSGTLAHLYFGPRLATERGYGHLLRHSRIANTNEVLDPIPLELPTAGSGDFRAPGLSVRHADGSIVLDLVYREHTIVAGKPALDGLPSTYVEDDDEAHTVEVLLVDGNSNLRVKLLTTIYAERPVVTRSMRVVNDGTSDVKLTTAMSAVLDLPDADWHALQLSGAWGREGRIVDVPVARGSRVMRSQRGSSGHQQNPFIILRRPATTEAAGEAVALSLVYSGSFLAEVEVDPNDTVRARLGMDPETIRWRITSGMDLQIPEAVLVWTDEGIGGVSDAYHRLYRERLVAGPWRDKPRPVLLNSWEGVYFDFDEDTLVDMATAARDLGAELFVLDDGWFG
jgi:alpha-galactosidase